jgi:hypothetical protein
MRRLVPVLVCTFACGGNNSAKDDAPPGPDDGATDAPPDAPVLPPCESPVNGTNITARRIGTFTITNPMLVTSPPGDARLFVVAQNGEIHIVENEVLHPTPFIDLSDEAGGPVRSGGELGLLGLAFHPQYHLNRQFFVYYTRNHANDAPFTLRNVVARCEATEADPNVADRDSCVEILAIRDRFTNHNGGMIEFGLDGKLYIGTGDGGSGGDPDGNAQTLTDGQPVANSIALQGKLLRIDVDNKDAGKEYGVPSDNPFLTSGAPEVFALGLRNPWRWSFDTATGDIWIGDVGQGPNNDPVEELNYVKAGELGGKNFGWDTYEGNNCFTSPCEPTGFHFPQDTRSQAVDQWFSIIGGQVYRGTCYPDIVGHYFYGDHFRANLLVRATPNPDGTITTEDLNVPNLADKSSIHAAADGELYMTVMSNGGRIFRIEAGP